MIMAKPPARGQGATRFPGLFDWLYSPWGSIRPFGSGQPARIEDYTGHGVYVVRAELPGLDPEKDVEVKVRSKSRGRRSSGYRSSSRNDRPLLLVPGQDSSRTSRCLWWQFDSSIG
jgi:hypothetical protein